MSGSSLDGLDIAYVEFNEQAGKWSFEICEAACYAYEPGWEARLQEATRLDAAAYLLLHSEYGHYIGRAVSRFIREHQLEYKVGLVASHGHTTFHMPGKGMTAQLGDGASIAAELSLPVVTDLRALDVALGGEGAPIVPIGEQLLWNEYGFYLNIGGIANISIRGDQYIAFDVCPANRVLNLLVKELGKQMDENGAIAASGSVNEDVLSQLNALSYYARPFPKSLANDFGTGVVLPLVKKAGSIPDALRTYVEHIAVQVSLVIKETGPVSGESEMLVTGGGAFNRFLVERLSAHLESLHVRVKVPDPPLVEYKEAVVMALIGVLRWRQELNVLSSVTGAGRDSVGGALWLG